MKKIIAAIAVAITLVSCSPGSGRWVAGKTSAEYFRKQREERNSRIIVKPSEAVAFKKIEGKNVVLTERPGPDDLITITVFKKD